MSADRKFPLLRYILLCGEVCEADDGLPDAYGILSETTILTEPGEEQYFELSLYFLISIYSEDESQTYPIDLTVKAPSDHEGEVGRIELGNQNGRFISTLGSSLSIEIDRPGTFWFKAYYEGRLLGEIPLKVHFLQAVNQSKSVH